MWSRLTTTVAACVAAAALAVPAPPAHAAVLLEDSFDQENGGVGVLAYNAFANWDVVKEEVDLIGNGFWDWRPGNGLYVDLVSNEAGAIASKQEFTLVPGDYVLRFDLSGSAFSPEDSMTVTLGSVFSEDFTLPFDEDFSARTHTIRVDSPTTGRLMFDHDPPDDTGGLLLDDVLLTGPDSGQSQPPPEPPPPPPPDPPPSAPEDADQDGVADAFDRSVVTEPPQPEETATAKVVSGTVLILDRGVFRPLQGSETVPIGATIDATDGAARITVAADTEGGETYSGTFSEGTFKLNQIREEGRRARRRERAGRPLALITELVLKGGTAACPAQARVAMAGGKRRRVRRLWGDGKGRFRTRGRFGAATVRGTVWLTKDRCDGTLVRVEEGKVAVEDFGRDRTVIVRAGERYLAKEPAGSRVS